MNDEQLRTLTRAWPGVSYEYLWQHDLILKVGGKMFCGLCVEGSEAGKLSFKVEDERFLEFTDRDGFRPAPYMARARWVTVDHPEHLREEELAGLLRAAYELIRAKLSKRLQRELSD